MVGVRVTSRDPELLDGVQRDRQNRSECAPVHLIVDIHTIQGDIALVATSSIHSSTARINISIHIGAIPCVRNARLQG